MGGLWVDYNLMSTVPGLFVLGEANFSDHGANRLGASALMQGLADGYFVIPYTIGDYLARPSNNGGHSTAPEFKRVTEARHRGAHPQASWPSKGTRHSVRLPPRAGPIMWDKCGMAATRAASRRPHEIPELRDEFWERDVCVTGSGDSLNQELEKPAAWPTSSSSAS
jgi:succinate dehydrogenase / fumarate reductase flavoprotein subunit